MITEQFATHFAQDWVNSWNTHDLERIMEHYDDNITFRSPFIIQLVNDPTGTISNKQDLRAYFKRALELFPDLHFELYKTFVSIDSVVLYYFRSGRNLYAAEFMEFNKQGKVISVAAHYTDK